MIVLKVAVYGIAKNEVNNIDGWFKNISSADHVLLLDTGSTDGTVKRAKELGIHVFEASIVPWDEARAKNIAMSLLPADIDFCICMDLDEHIADSDWKARFLEDMKPGIYLTHSLGRDGLNNFLRPVQNIHPRFGYYWKGFRSAINSYPGYDHKVFGFDDKIIANSIPGDQDRFDNRDPLYVESYKNYAMMLEQDRQGIPSSLQIALAYLALSYYEIEDYRLFLITHSMFLKGLDNMSKADYGLKFVEILDYAKSMVMPEIAESKYLEWYEKSLDPAVPLSRLIMFYTLTQNYERAIKYIHEYEKDKEVLVAGKERDETESVIFIDESIDQAVKYCLLASKRGSLLKNELSHIVSVYSAIGWGKPHKDLALRAIDYGKL